MTADGLNRYSFSEKYSLSDRQGAYYLNAICFIGLAEKTGKNTYSSSFSLPRFCFLLVLCSSFFVSLLYDTSLLDKSL